MGAHGKNSRIDIGAIRREQIVEAAATIIAEKGLQSLSLSEIEKKAGMSRGQLTYYFPAKEEILLAVFDQHLQRMCQRIGTPDGQAQEAVSGWVWVQHLLRTLLEQPAVSSEFHCLQYTFLSQIGHREDFRRRLATLYDRWRDSLAQGLAEDLARQGPTPRVSPRALASLIQALLHGLTMQAAADPDAFQPEEMAQLCLDMLGSYLGLPPASTTPMPTGTHSPIGNGIHSAVPTAAGDA